MADATEQPNEAPPLDAPPDEETKDLPTLTAEANQQYALRNFAQAAELYSRATALQAEQNGEMALENADLLYTYGRCLYKVAVANSDVLGGKVAGESSGGKGEGSKKRKRNGLQGDAKSNKSGEEVAGKVLEKVVEEKEGEQPPSIHAAASSSKPGQSTPFFQISGDDAEWDESASEEEADEGDRAAKGEGEGGEEEEEEDDFATAYEILDLARILLNGKKEALQSEATSENKGKGRADDPSTADSSELRQVKERLADTHDLQAEISLENERFQDAITDSRASLALKQELFPVESSIIAEAHFKLSLALEFASVTTTKDAEGAESSGSVAATGSEATVDTKLRKEAADHLSLAIQSSKARVKNEQENINALQGEAAETKKKEIQEVQEIISDMEQRLEELNTTAQPLSAAALLGPAGAAPDSSNALGGILGSVLGESASDQKKRIDAAVQGANDLSGLVKHKKKPKEQPCKDSTGSAAATEGADSTNGTKRKADDTGSEAAEGKRAKTEELQ